MKALRDGDISRLVSDMCELTKDEALFLLAGKITLQGVINLKNCVHP